MGSVLTPAMTGLKGSKDLPNACTLNGRCKEVCPVNIPLPDMLRSLRARQFQEGMPSGMTRWGLWLWAVLATRPALYRFGTAVSNLGLRILARGRGRISAVPLAGGWTRARDLPQPEAGTFMQQYRKRR
jgi:L-lactate dehydrogenase complex protein LldF